MNHAEARRIFHNAGYAGLVVIEVFVAHIHPAYADQELLAKLSQPTDQTAHSLARFDVIITYETVDSFDTMLVSDDSFYR